MPSRREKWPRPRFFPMPIVRREMPARLDTSKHILRRLLFDSLPQGCHRGHLSLVRHIHRALCQQRRFSRSLSITVKNQMCGLLLVLVDGPLWIRERLVVAACIIPFVTRLLLRRIKVQHHTLLAVVRLCFGSACFGRPPAKMFKLDVPPQTGPFIGK